MFDAHGTILMGEDRVAEEFSRKRDGPVAIFSRSNLVRTFIGVPLPAAATGRQLASPAV